MKTFQLTIKIYNTQVTTTLNAANLTQAKLLAISLGWKVQSIIEVRA
jgi:hypothetical protein